MHHLLFMKRKEAPQLNAGLLAEALSIHSDNINLRKMQMDNESSFFLGEEIKLNEHLNVTIDNIYFINDTDTILWYYYFKLYITIYVDDIKMGTYECKLDLAKNDMLYRKWDCEDKDIIHAMPKQFITYINEWSNHIISSFENEKEAIELKKEQEWEKEEEILSQYW